MQQSLHRQSNSPLSSNHINSVGLKLTRASQDIALIKQLCYSASFQELVSKQVIAYLFSRYCGICRDSKTLACINKKTRTLLWRHLVNKMRPIMGRLLLEKNQRTLSEALSSDVIEKLLISYTDDRYTIPYLAIMRNLFLLGYRTDHEFDYWNGYISPFLIEAGLDKKTRLTIKIAYTLRKRSFLEDLLEKEVYKLNRGKALFKKIGERKLTVPEAILEARQHAFGVFETSDLAALLNKFYFLLFLVAIALLIILSTPRESQLAVGVSTFVILVSVFKTLYQTTSATLRYIAPFLYNDSQFQQALFGTLISNTCIEGLDDLIEERYTKKPKKKAHYPKPIMHAGGITKTINAPQPSFSKQTSRKRILLTNRQQSTAIIPVSSFPSVRQIEIDGMTLRYSLLCLTLLQDQLSAQDRSRFFLVKLQNPFNRSLDLQVAGHGLSSLIFVDSKPMNDQANCSRTEFQQQILPKLLEGQFNGISGNNKSGYLLVNSKEEAKQDFNVSLSGNSKLMKFKSRGAFGHLRFGFYSQAKDSKQETESIRVYRFVGIHYK